MSEEDLELLITTDDPGEDTRPGDVDCGKIFSHQNASNLMTCSRPEGPAFHHCSLMLPSFFELEYPASSTHGSENENVTPEPSFGVAHKRPRWFSMIERLTDRPIPIPSSLVV